MRFVTIGFALLTALAAPASADVSVSFQEAAPRDSFTIRNTGACDLGPVRVTIDLAGSTAGLIFDTTASGAGLSVFQPFRLEVGGDWVTSVGDVTDGSTSISLDLEGLPPNRYVLFTIDVDDSLPGGPLGPTMIDGSEIAGGRAVVATRLGGESLPPAEALFGPGGVATVRHSACLSQGHSAPFNDQS